MRAGYDSLLHVNKSRVSGFLHADEGRERRGLVSGR
jgi:hypothetical protein